MNPIYRVFLVWFKWAHEEKWCALLKTPTFSFLLFKQTNRTLKRLLNLTTDLRSYMTNNQLDIYSAITLLLVSVSNQLIKPSNGFYKLDCLLGC